MPQRILVTGPSRSGKSEWAETLAKGINTSVIYVATALENPDDLQWQQRIEKHRLRRPSHWQTLAVPYDLSMTIEQAKPPCCLLIDSLGTWVANGLDQDEATWKAMATRLLEGTKQASINIIFVAEETGWGVIPAYESGRLFRDRLGQLTRKLGTLVDTTYLVTGGHVLNLSLLGKPLP
ncbi:MAG: bifunctional adenosylcobinamide kinase/adenosylcobinamide-phosphate guanylyltransferase [Crocosphaera sp.]